MIVELSQIKKQCGSDTKVYFDGKVSDGQQTLRFVGFNEKIHDHLVKFHQNREPVLIKNCNLHRNKRDQQLQAFLYEGKTVIHKSGSKFDVKPSEYDTQVTRVNLEDLPLLERYQKVHINIKVTKVRPPVTTGQDVIRHIQKITVADETGQTTLQLWEEDVNTLQEGSSYELKNISVSEYYQEKYLTFATDSIARNIEDIGSVMYDAEEIEGMTVYKHVTVVGIQQFHRTEKCLYKHCKGKLVPLPSKPQLAQCEKCQMLQRRDSANLSVSAKIVMKGDIPANLTLYATGAQLASITNLPADTISEEDILLAPPFSLTYRGSTLTGVFRSQ